MNKKPGNYFRAGFLGYPIGVYSTKEATIGLRQLKAIDRIPDPDREILG